MVVARQIAKVLVVELRLHVPALGARDGDDDGKDQGESDIADGKEQELHTCLFALGVRLGGPRLLLREDGAQALLALGLRGGNPRRRERDARLGKLARIDARQLKAHGCRGGIGPNVARELTVAPRAQGLFGGRRRLGKLLVERDREGHVLGVLAPVGADELPVELGRVAPRHHAAGEDVVDLDRGRGVVLVRGKDLELERLLTRFRDHVGGVDAVVAARCRRGLGERRSVDRDARHRDRRCGALLVLGKGDLPKNAVHAVVELKGAHLAHVHGAVAPHRGLEVDRRHGIVGPGRCGHREHGNANECCGEGGKRGRDAMTDVHGASFIPFSNRSGLSIVAAEACARAGRMQVGPLVPARQRPNRCGRASWSEHMCSEIVALRGREVEPIARGHNNSARGRGFQQIPLADNRSPFSAGLPVAARAVAGSPVFGRAMAHESSGARMPNGSEASANAPWRHRRKGAGGNGVPLRLCRRSARM